MLSDLVSGTEIESWINDYTHAQNGRSAWLALKTHYEGGSNEYKKIIEDTAILEMLH